MVRPAAVRHEPRIRSGLSTWSSNRSARRALFLVLVSGAATVGCPHEPCSHDVPCEDEFRVDFRAPGDASVALGTYVFTVDVEGTSASATCTVTSDASSTGCSLALPDGPDVTKQPRVVTVRSAEGLEGFSVWVPSTPTAVDVSVVRDGSTIFQKSYTPNYADVRSEAECPVLCRAFHADVQLS